MLMHEKTCVIPIFIVTWYVLINSKHSDIKGLHCIFQNFHGVMPLAQLNALAPTPIPSALAPILLQYIYILVYKQAREQVTKVVTDWKRVNP